jgi:hypothetical protein
LSATFGYTQGRAPRDLKFRAALDRELDRVREFLEIAEETVS